MRDQDWWLWVYTKTMQFMKWHELVYLPMMSLSAMKLSQGVTPNSQTGIKLRCWAPRLSCIWSIVKVNPGHSLDVKSRNTSQQQETYKRNTSYHKPCKGLSIASWSLNYITMAAMGLSPPCPTIDNRVSKEHNWLTGLHLEAISCQPITQQDGHQGTYKCPLSCLNQS